MTRFRLLLQRFLDKKSALQPPLDIRLLTCLGAETDHALLAPFVSHYRALGILPGRMHVILQAPDASSQALQVSREALQQEGVTHVDEWVGPYSSDALWQRRRDLQTRVAGTANWVLNADIDEFHDYPCSLAEMCAYLEALGANVLQGPLIDRHAQDGTFPAIAPDLSLEDQFPVWSNAMVTIGKRPGHDDAAGTYKMMLHRGDVFPAKGGHFPKHSKESVKPVFAHGAPLALFPKAKSAAFRADQPARVHHFKWHAGVADRWRARLSRTDAVSKPAADYASRMLAHVDRHDGRIDVNGAERIDPPPPPVDWQERFAQYRRQGKALLAARRPASALNAKMIAPGWRVRQLTVGSSFGAWHAHSYYDIPVLSPCGRSLVAYRGRISNRLVRPDDTVLVGCVDLEKGAFRPVAETRAWSWQQGPMSQYLPDGRLVWCDRDAQNRFVGCLHDPQTGTTRIVSRPVYAVDPKGRFALSLDMARLNRMRPGYGFVGGRERFRDDPAPGGDGMWRLDLETDRADLILSLSHAVEFLAGKGLCPDRHRSTFWFNHPKISPCGTRFTVKLRWRDRDLQEPWNGTMGVSLTCAVEGPGADGSELSLLAPATSHVMWYDTQQLYFWSARDKCVCLVQDGRTSDQDGRLLQRYSTDLFDGNAHIRHVPDHPKHAVFDTAYRREIDLRLADLEAQTATPIATFSEHVPARGPHRCDLHPVLSNDGSRIIVTSLADGARQIYCIDRT